jgi:hypothetical protein
MKKVIITSLLVLLVVPMITYASWWNPFTWGWVNSAAEYVTSFISIGLLDTENTESEATVSVICPEVADEGEYINTVYQNLNKKYSVLSSDNYDNLDKNLILIKDLKDSISKETRKLSYLSQAKWALFKDNLMKSALASEEWNQKMRLVDLNMSEAEAEILDNQIGDLGLKALEYNNKAIEIYQGLSFEDYPKVYSNCADKI